MRVRVLMAICIEVIGIKLGRCRKILKLHFEPHKLADGVARVEVVGEQAVHP